MTTTTVIAKDTSSAMDDIMSKLGDDAVILSTKHKDGKVHMTATTRMFQQLQEIKAKSTVFKNF